MDTNQVVPAPAVNAPAAEAVSCMHETRCHLTPQEKLGFLVCEIAGIILQTAQEGLTHQFMYPELYGESHKPNVNNKVYRQYDREKLKDRTTDWLFDEAIDRLKQRGILVEYGDGDGVQFSKKTVQDWVNFASSAISKAVSA